MGPAWGPPGSYRPQMCPMLAPWTLLSGFSYLMETCYITWSHQPPWPSVGGAYCFQCDSSMFVGNGLIVRFKSLHESRRQWGNTLWYNTAKLCTVLLTAHIIWNKGNALETWCRQQVRTITLPTADSNLYVKLKKTVYSTIYYYPMQQPYHHNLSIFIMGIPTTGKTVFVLKWAWITGIICAIGPRRVHRLTILGNRLVLLIMSWLPWLVYVPMMGTSRASMYDLLDCQLFYGLRQK